MNDASSAQMNSQFSLRRTVLTLLGALGAFAVLTASYATAELPEGATSQIEMEASAR